MSAEIYEIRIWRGYVKAQLYAVAGSDKRIATSRYFKLARTEVPTADALRALSELRAELEVQGDLRGFALLSEATDRLDLAHKPPEIEGAASPANHDPVWVKRAAGDVNEGRSDRCAPLDLYANRTAGRAARLAAFAANPGIASKTSASTTRMK